jgi:hypothetical protein
MGSNEPRHCQHCGHFFAPIRYKKHLKRFALAKARTKEQRKMLERWVEMMTSDVSETEDIEDDR